MMNIKVRLTSVLLVAVALVLIFVGYNSLASAQTGGEEEFRGRPAQANPGGEVDYEPVPGGPGIISINGTTFVPETSDDMWLGYDGELYNPSTTLGGHYSAPVNLPEGAIVSQVVVFYFDGVPSDLTVWLQRKPVNTFPDTMTRVPSTGDGGYGYAISTDMDYATVDNLSYSYYVEVWLPAGTNYYLSLVTVRVDYSYPSYLPAVIR